MSLSAWARNIPAASTGRHEARVAQGRDLVWRGWDREQRTEGAAAETFGWLRFGRREIAEHRDGLGMSGAGIELFKTLGQLNREQLIDPDFCRPTRRLPRTGARWR